MHNRLKFYPAPTIRIIFFFLILFTLGFSLISAQGNVSKGLELIENDKAKGILTDEEALVQKFYYGFNKSKLDEKYFFKNDIPGKCGTGILIEYKQKKDTFSHSSIAEIESCFSNLRKRAITESKYISPSGKFELTYSTEGENAVSAEDADVSGVPDYVERIAEYFDYSWKFVVDTLGYLAPPIGEGKYQVIFENSGYFGYTDILQDRLTFISMSSTFDGFSENMDPEGYAIGAAKVTAIHEFMHACQIVYNNWKEPSWIAEAHATWVEDIGYDYVNDYYYSFLHRSHITNPNRSLTSGDGYSDCIFLHYLTQKYGVQVAREIWERIEIFSWEIGLNTINAVLSDYESSLEQTLPEYFSWCYLTGENADSRLPSFEEAADYPTSQLTQSITGFPDYIHDSEYEKLSAVFLKYSINETSGNLSVEFESDDKGYLVLITYFNDNSVDIKYYSNERNYFTERYYSLIDTEYKLEEINDFVIIPVNFNVFEKLKYSISVDKYREVVFNHTPVSSSEDISPKTIFTSIEVADPYKLYNTLTLNYKFGNGPFQTLPLLTIENSNKYSAEISGISDGDTISYYFSYYDSLRSFNNTLPLNAPDSLFSFMCGVDNIAPIVKHNSITGLTKYDFPRRLLANISDNYKVASAILEYTVNDKEIKHLDFIKLNDSVYNAPLFTDTAFSNINDKISYRIIASDSAISNNTTIFPESGFVNLTINRGYKYESKVDSFIDGYYIDEFADTVYVENDIAIRDLNLFFRATFIENDSLLISLTASNGEQVEITRLSPQNCDSLSVIFDESADFTLTSSDPLFTDDYYITGHFKPEFENLDTFNGLSAQGEWIIHLYNLSRYNFFVFDDWGLILQTDSMISDREEPIEIGVPIEYSLSNNYPNPFNPATTFSYSLPKQSNVEIKIHDVLGREVAVLVNEDKLPGSYKIHFDGSILSSGVYFCTMRSNEFIQTRKLLLLK